MILKILIIEFNFCTLLLKIEIHSNIFNNFIFYFKFIVNLI
jgi:hypothetical protein